MEELKKKTHKKSFTLRNGCYKTQGAHYYYYYHLVPSFTATSELGHDTGFETQILWSSICGYNF